MTALHAARRTLLSSIAILAPALGAMALRWPNFFSGGAGECVAVATALAASPTALALLLGLLLRERLAAAISVAPLGAAIGGSLALLSIDTETTAGWLTALCIAGAMGGALHVLLSLLPCWSRRTGLLVAAALFLAGSTVPSWRRPVAGAAIGDRPRILVYGLDAGTWTILDQLMADGGLPALRRIRDEGASGILRSEIESASPRVWTSIATGKPPADHGVVDFFCTQNQDLKTRRIWEILQAQGWSVGLFQWLVTWPPDPYDPFVVPAWMARGPETRPAGLRFIKELEIAFQTGEFDQWLANRELGRLLRRLREWGCGYLDHGLRFKTVMKALEHVKVAVQHPRWEQQYAAKRTLQLLLNGDVYLELYRRHQPDFSCFICYGTDNLAHKFWQFHFPDDFGMDHATAAPLKDLLTDYYRECDALLGEILPLLGPQTTVAVVSDHGFTSIGVGGESHQRELRPKMSRIAAELSLTEKEVYWSSVATRGYFRPVPGAAGAAQACERIVDWLMRCEAVGGPRPFIATLRDDGQVEVAVNTDAALERGTPLLTPTGRLRFDELVDVEDRTGNHSIDGIMLWRGPAIRRGARIAPAHLVDVTPTLLHLHGLPIGADMKGRPIEEALTEEFRAEHEVERIESWDDQVAVTREDVGAGDDSAMKGYMNATGYIDSGDEERSSRDAALGPSRDGER